MWWALKKAVHKLYPHLTTMGNSQSDWEALRSTLKDPWQQIPNSKAGLGVGLGVGIPFLLLVGGIAGYIMFQRHSKRRQNAE
jgi:hypothetical protein